MTGKSAGATKAPPIGTTPVVTSILPGGTTTYPPSAKATTGPPGGLKKVSTQQGTPSKGNGNAKTDKPSGKLKIDESANNGSNAKGKNKEQPKVQLDSADKTGNQKGHVKVSLQEELFVPDGAMNFYGSAQPEPDINPEEMETDTEEQISNKKRKQPPVLVNPS